MALKDFVATKMPLYLSSGTKKITLGVASSTSSPYAYPAMSNDASLTGLSIISPYTGGSVDTGVANFKKWWSQNPFLITEMNIRASAQATLPSQIIVETPDIYSGNIQTQIIDIGANFNANQYQNNIVTIKDLCVFVGRMSTIKPVGNATSSTSVNLYIDCTIRCFISLELALQQAVIGGLVSAEGVADVIEGISGNIAVKRTGIDDLATQFNGKIDWNGSTPADENLSAMLRKKLGL